MVYFLMRPVHKCSKIIKLYEFRYFGIFHLRSLLRTACKALKNITSNKSANFVGFLKMNSALQANVLFLLIVFLLKYLHFILADINEEIHTFIIFNLMLPRIRYLSHHCPPPPLTSPLSLVYFGFRQHI